MNKEQSERGNVNDGGMVLELDHISKIYGDVHAVDDLSLTVPQGEWLAIVGSSGSGKTTLMNIIGCLDTPTEGTVRLEGRRLEDLNAGQLADVRKDVIGLVFQKFYLVPHLTAVENVMVAQYYHSVVDERQALEALDKVGLKDRAHHLPSQLSGGMRQRCALIRTLATGPKILLLDEPFSALDYQTRLSVSSDIWQIIRQEHKTALLVTHDISEAISMSDRVVVLSHRPAVVQATFDMGDLRQLDPMARRDTEEFHTFFNAIWKELDIHA